MLSLFRLLTIVRCFSGVRTSSLKFIFSIASAVSGFLLKTWWLLILLLLSGHSYSRDLAENNISDTNKILLSGGQVNSSLGQTTPYMRWQMKTIVHNPSEIKSVPATL